MNPFSIDRGRRRCLLAGAALGLGATATRSMAQPSAWPSRPLRFVIPNPPGGITDLLGRIVADKLGAAYRQTAVVDNRAGAGGHIAGQAVARSPADGYTILVGTVGIHAAYASYAKLAYDPASELTVVTILGEAANVVLVPAASPIRTFGELLAKAKSDPGSLSYATAGAGSSIHMVTALFEVTSGAKVNYVPYKGSGPAMVDLIGGQVQVMFENLPTGLPHVLSGKVRALAVTGAARDPRLPAVPTVAESGLPGFEGISWWTVAVPRATPAPLVDKLGRDLRQALGTPEVTALLDKQSVTPVLDTPEHAADFVKKETAKWNSVIRATHMTVE